jgi:hypothetical protein
MPERKQPDTDWRPRPGWRRHNLAQAIAKQRAKLERSRAHVAIPRDGDHARWASMAAEIDQLQAILDQIDAGGPNPLDGEPAALADQFNRRPGGHRKG